MKYKERILWALIGAATMFCLICVAVMALLYVRLGPQQLAVLLAAPQPTATLLPSVSVQETPLSTQTPLSTLRPTEEARSSVPLVLNEQTRIPTETRTVVPPTVEPTATSGPTKTKKPTKTPKPTATPTLAWPEALAEPGASKLGLHIQWNNSPEILEYVRRIKPPVLKAVGDFGFAADVKKDSPSTIIIGRLTGTADEHGFRMEGDPVAAAQAFVNERLATYQANPLVDYWEGVNEPGVGETMAWYAQFEAERVRYMAELGFHSAIGAFSAGVPEWEAFEQFLPAVTAAKQHDGILSLHEYDAPTLYRSAGAGLPGHGNYADRGALALRYRWWYEDFLEPRNLVIPLVISEMGVDGLIGNRPGPKGKGWRDFGDYWESEGLGSDPIDVYLQQLEWYDAELQRDDYVIGCAVFTVGAMNDDWESYDITAILRQIAHYAVALP